MSQSYAYYPGCSALKSAVELDVSARKVMAALGLAWIDLNEAACCGSRECGGLRIADELLALANNARTLAMAEDLGAKTVVNVCSTCQLELEGDNQRLQQDPELLMKVNDLLHKIGRHYNGSVTVKHLLYIMLDDLGLTKIGEGVKRPLTGLRIAPFYGCHLLRPSEAHALREDPYNPHSFGELIEALGATEVKYNGATGCCGFHSIIVSKKLALRICGGHLSEAKGQGADLVVTPCPLCHAVLDGYQNDIESELKIKIGLPVLHLPQLVGLAMGMDPKEIGLFRHMVNPRRALAPFLPL